MTDLAELKEKIKYLEDVEEIKQLKYKYQRCLDTKDWDGLAETFVKDATTAFSDGQYTLKGVDKIMEFLRSSPLGEDKIFIGVHHVHHPEIKITSDTTATGIWALYCYMVNKTQKTGLRILAYYHDEYVKMNGQWKINFTGYDRILEETWKREDIPSMELVAG
ncbi:MAG: nuclear transport factor 2 family protein [Deltaproteobacteria bacterium]|nr:nuclear transport factor 2 family protein [Deltaproteobacteria bacterium]